MAQYTSQEFRQQRSQLINQVMASDLHGKRIYLLGSAEFGPTNEPILVKSTVGLYNKFGKQGTLIDAFHAVKYVNKDNKVYLVKTTGEHANAYLNVNIKDGEIIEDGFTIAAAESNELYNNVEIIVDIESISFVFPEDFGIARKSYKYKDYPTIDKLANAINKDTRNKKSKLYAYYSVDPATPTENAFFVCNPVSVYMYGGQCGLNYSKNLLYNCLARTYDMIESEDIDIIVPVDAFLDDIYPDDSEGTQDRYGMRYYQSTKDYLTEDFTGKQLSYMDQCINFCIKQLNFGVVTLGILGFNPKVRFASDYLAEADELKEMYQACFQYNLKHCINPFYAFMVSCVAGDIKYNHGTIVDNGYLAYASFCSKIKINCGTTNIPIASTIGIYEEFSEEVLQEMAETGIVTFRHSPLYNTPVVYDGITASPNNENLKLFANVRMIQMCISYINKLLQSYIGYNMVDLIKDEVIVEDLHSILEVLVAKNIITQYNFKIMPYYATGEIKVYLTLLTCYMVKAITLCTVVDVEFEEEV